MVDRNAYIENLKQLFALSDEELLEKAKKKYEERGGLAETLLFIQDYAEINRRGALIIYITSDMVEAEGDSDGD